MRNIVLVMIAISGMLSSDIYASVYSFPKNYMIQSASVIAILEITDIDKCVATAKIEKVIKGDVSDEIKISSGDFQCAYCINQKGRFLAFLRFDGKIFWPANDSRSLFPLLDNKIKWEIKSIDENGYHDAWEDLDEVIKEIAEEIQTPTIDKKVLEKLQRATQ